MKTHLCHTFDEALKHTSDALASVRRGEYPKAPKHLLEPGDHRETHHRKMKKIFKACAKFKSVKLRNPRKVNDPHKPK